MNINQLATHKIQHKEVEFDSNYIAQCLSCLEFLFELKIIDQLIKWNDINYFMIHQNLIPSSIEINQQNYWEHTGPIAYNIHNRVYCKCKKLKGMFIISTYLTCKLFSKRLLIKVDEIKVITIKPNKISEMNIKEIYRLEFQKYIPDTFQTLNVAQEPKLEIKRTADIIQTSSEEQQIKKQLREGLTFFANVLKGLEKRMYQMEYSCSKFKKEIQILVPLMKKIAEKKQSKNKQINNDHK